MGRNALVAALALIALSATTVFAQPTATATPTVPTVTPTLPPKAALPAGASIAPVERQLFADASATAVSTPFPCGAYPHVSAQVDVASGTCSSYTLKIEGKVRGSVGWATITSFSTSDAAAGASAIKDASIRATYCRGNLSAISTCTISRAYLYMGP